MGVFLYIEKTFINPIIVSVAVFEIIDVQFLQTLNYENSRSSGVKVHSTNQKPMFDFLADVFESNVITVTVFYIFEVKIS